MHSTLEFEFKVQGNLSPTGSGRKLSQPQPLKVPKDVWGLDERSPSKFKV